MKISYLTDFSTDWLADWCMPSDKRNLYSYGLDFSTVQLCFISRCAFLPTTAVPILLSWFYQNLYPCSPFLSPLPRRWRFVVVLLRVFMEDLVTAVIAEVFNTLSFWLNRSVNCYTTLITKCNCSFAFSLWLIGPGGACTVTIVFSVFPYSGKKN